MSELIYWYDSYSSTDDESPNSDSLIPGLIPRYGNYSNNSTDDESSDSDSSIPGLIPRYENY